MYIADHINFKRKNDIEIEDLESIWLQINFPNNKPILLNFVYRPPSSNQIWIEKYEQQFTSAESTNLDYILLGDYNIQYTTTSTYNNIKWAKVVHDFGLNQLIKSPTRVTNNSSSIIDHIYSTNEQAIFEILVPKIAKSDHYPIALTYHNHIKTCHENKYKTIFYRSFSGLNLELFLNDLAKTNFEVMETIYDPNEAFNYFYAIMNGILTKHVPFKEKRVKRLKQPDWYNDEIKKCYFVEK